MKSTVLIDVNIFIDIFQEREPFWKSSAKVIEMISKKYIKGSFAAHTVSNLWYILRKTHTEEERRNLIRSILNCFEICSIDREIVLNALERSDFKDFEDCLQDECAQTGDCSWIITRNVEDYKFSKVPAVTPEQFLKQFA